MVQLLGNNRSGFLGIPSHLEIVYRKNIDKNMPKITRVEMLENNVMTRHDSKKAQHLPERPMRVGSKIG